MTINDLVQTDRHTGVLERINCTEEVRCETYKGA